MNFSPSYPRRRTALLAAGLTCMLSWLPASADTLAASYPDRPIKLLLPLAPGGATDTLARALAQSLGERLGQPVVIDHKPGGAGTIASAAAARAPADGYTLLFANFATHATAPSLFQTLPYEPVKDFKAVSLVASSPHLLLVSASSPIRNVGQLVGAAKGTSNKLNYGSSGVGSPLHLAGEYFKSETGIDMVHIPFKSSGPALAELMAGRIDVMFDNMSSGMPLVQTGKLRALAITSPFRSPLSPELQTVQEQGVRGFSTYGWWGVLAPRDVPPPVLGKLGAAIRASLASPELRKTLISQGFEPIGSSPEEFEAHISREITKWGAVIRTAGVRPE